MTITPNLLLTVRQALLLIVDAIERELGISPRTAELRKAERIMPIEN
jgi:hypothetical protein